MSGQLRRVRWLIAALLICLLNSGCNPFVALYFLFLLPRPKVPAACKALEGQKVLLFTYASPTARFESPSVAQELTRRVVRHLKRNVDDIELVDLRLVEDYIDSHPDCEVTKVAEHFEATRALYIEINDFSLYERESTQLYRGRAQIHLKVYDIEKDGELVWEDCLDLVYPGVRPVPVSDVSYTAFRLKVYEYVARRIATRFFAYRPHEDFTIN
ncbi:MAG TPA: hypothetical protein EYP14_14875 [Planctomycetaceae bacterium]|nr:hypothetical protein [Planctomycetaceae bacterium]